MSQVKKKPCDMKPDEAALYFIGMLETGAKNDYINRRVKNEQWRELFKKGFYENDKDAAFKLFLRLKEFFYMDHMDALVRAFYGCLCDDFKKCLDLKGQSELKEKFDSMKWFELKKCLEFEKKKNNTRKKD